MHDSLAKIDTYGTSLKIRVVNSYNRLCTKVMLYKQFLNDSSHILAAAWSITVLYKFLNLHICTQTSHVFPSMSTNGTTIYNITKQVSDRDAMIHKFLWWVSFGKLKNLQVSCTELCLHSKTKHTAITRSMMTQSFNVSWNCSELWPFFACTLYVNWACDSQDHTICHKHDWIPIIT